MKQPLEIAHKAAKDMTNEENFAIVFLDIDDRNYNACQDRQVQNFFVKLIVKGI